MVGSGKVTRDRVRSDDKWRGRGNSDSDGVRGAVRNSRDDIITESNVLTLGNQAINGLTKSAKGFVRVFQMKGINGLHTLTEIFVGTFSKSAYFTMKMTSLFRPRKDLFYNKSLFRSGFFLGRSNWVGCTRLSLSRICLRIRYGDEFVRGPPGTLRVPRRFRSTTAEPHASVQNMILSANARLPEGS